MISDKQVRDMAAAALASTIDEECSQHHSGITQEAALTARIGSALERGLVGLNVNGWTFRVVTQDVPDRGSKSLERAVGADLYVGIEVVSHGTRRSKGFLVQAKWEHDKRRQKDLQRQCNDMLDRTDAAYVWFYGSDGVKFLPANILTARTDRTIYRGRRLAPEFARILKCDAGDPSLGLPRVPNLRQSVGEMLDELRTRSAIGVSIKNTNG